MVSPEKLDDTQLEDDMKKVGYGTILYNIIYIRIYIY